MIENMKLFEINTMWEILFQHLVDIRDRISPVMNHLQNIADAEMNTELDGENESIANGKSDGIEDDSFGNPDDSISRRYIANHADEAYFLLSETLTNALMDAEAHCDDLLDSVNDLSGNFKEPEDRLLEEFEIEDVSFEDYAETCQRAGEKLEELSGCFAGLLSVVTDIKIQVRSGEYDFYVEKYMPDGVVFLVDWFEYLLELVEDTCNAFAEAIDAVNECIR